MTTTNGNGNITLTRGEMCAIVISINNMIKKGPEYGSLEKWTGIKEKLLTEINIIDGEE